jgi:hypothetical protein
MYNMNFTIGNKTFRFEIVLLIVLICIVLWGHLLCSCSSGKLIENLNNMNGDNYKYYTTLMGKGYSREGFTPANTNYGESATYPKLNKAISTKSWFTPNLTYAPGSKPSKGAQNILNRKPQPVPLPQGELDMFANTPFKPECCPNAYSNSMGCACMTTKQYNYLIERGGNNVPYSEY